MLNHAYNTISPHADFNIAYHFYRTLIWNTEMSDTQLNKILMSKSDALYDVLIQQNSRDF